jgi:DNA-binding PadR family transcriptional regulator
LTFLYICRILFVMARRPNSSKQTEALLGVLIAGGSRWRYGYDLSRETDLKSGTMYPILMRLQSQGWLEERWEEAAVAGKPRRHLYRLTAEGTAEAAALLRAAESRRPGVRLAAAGGSGAP